MVWAEIASLDVWFEIIVVSWLLVLICCSTSLNSTSWLVNWLLSIGLSGSWFCSCVVSSVRKVLKFCVKLSAPLAVAPLALAPLPLLDVGVVVGVVALLTGVVMGSPSSDLDIE